MNAARQALIISLSQLLLSLFVVSNVVGIISHKNEEQISGNHIAELRTKAEQGNVGSQYELGLMSAVGKKVPRNYQKAAMWFRKAAKNGDKDSQRNLEILCEESPLSCR